MKDFPLPTYIDRDRWIYFVELRQAKGKRAPFTHRAAVLILKKLTDMHSRGLDPNEALDEAVIHGWSSVFDPKGGIVRSVEADRTVQYLQSRQFTPDPTNHDRITQQLRETRAKLRRVA